MNYIYLISSDGHRDSIDLDYYCVTLEACKDLIISEIHDYTYSVVTNIKIDPFVEGRDWTEVQIDYYEEDYPQYPEKRTYVIRRIPQYKP